VTATSPVTAPIFASTNVADFLLAVSYWSRSPRAAA